MTAVIALRPEDDRGKEILDELERKTDAKPQVIDDGTRRYSITAEHSDVDALDRMLDTIDPGWRNHITNWQHD
jgi:hypothetical protein